MDVKKTAREIGMFETAVNLAQVRDSEDVIRKVGTSLPMPDSDIDQRVEQIADWLLAFDKSKYLFLTPEIALIEKMAQRAGNRVEMIIALPCDMDAESKDRLQHNLPRNALVTVLEEPYFPASFFPGNGMIVICGYSGGNRAMVLPDTYRMAEHYSGFLGKKVFVPYAELGSATRYDNWLECSQQKLSATWRSA